MAEVVAKINCNIILEYFRPYNPAVLERKVFRFSSCFLILALCEFAIIDDY